MRQGTPAPSSAREAAHFRALVEVTSDWLWEVDAEAVYLDLLNGSAPLKVKDALEAMRRLLGDNDASRAFRSVTGVAVTGMWWNGMS